MLLAYYVRTCSFQSFRQVAIGCLQWAKHCNVKGLELVRGVRGKSTQNNVVFETKFHNLEGLVRTEAVTYQHPWFLVGSCLGLGVKYTFDPLQADLGVVISSFGAGIMPSRGIERRSVASMGRRRPNDHWFQRLTRRTCTFYGSHHSALDTCTSVVPPVIFADKDLGGALHREHDARLVHVVHILGNDIGPTEFLFNHLKPVHDLVIDVLIVTVPVHRLHPPRFELWMTSLECLSPVLIWTLDRSVGRGTPAGDSKG